jgi:hypothetical protein
MKVKLQTEEEVMSFFQNTHKTFYAWFSSALIVVIVALSANVRAADVPAPEPPVADETRSEEDAATTSDQLRSNLEETISEGSKALRALPKSRRKITRTRVANLERQLKRKEREREQLQESLAVLRSDFYRRLAAIRKNDGQIAAADLENREKRLRDDYDLRAESFEEELKALDADLIAIQGKVHQLRAQYETAERLKPAKRVVPSDETSVYSETVLAIPERIDPFALRSFVDRARGRDTASRPVLWALKGEIAFQQGDLDSADRFWVAGSEVNSLPLEFREDLEINLAHLAYVRGDFVTSYEIFAESLRGRSGEALSMEESYTMAVLSYLNGLMDDTRSYLESSDEESRARFESVIGRVGEATSV